MEEKILSLLISFLGEYSKQCGDWYSFNCPCCAEENFSTPDGKYNLLYDNIIELFPDGHTEVVK